MCHNMSQKHFYLQGIHFSRLTPGATQGFVVRADTSEVVLGKSAKPSFFRHFGSSTAVYLLEPPRGSWLEPIDTIEVVLGCTKLDLFSIAEPSL